MMVFEKREGLVVGTFAPLTGIRGLRAFFSTRLGGVSRGVFESLNVGLHTDDTADCVMENRRRLWNATSFDPAALARQQQVHSDRVTYASSPGTMADTDASYTDRPGVFLSVTVADCVPILFCSPHHHVAGVIHAGWRGTLSGLALKTIRQVSKHLDVDPATIVAVIGPSISEKHYEVGPDVASRFDRRWIRSRGAATHLDLWEANRDQLMQAGVGEVHVAGLCTKERNDLFFSHRAGGGRSGRMVGVIGFDKP